MAYPQIRGGPDDFNCGPHGVVVGDLLLNGERTMGKYFDTFVKNNPKLATLIAAIAGWLIERLEVLAKIGDGLGK
jgi:hypothetical protein